MLVKIKIKNHRGIMGDCYNALTFYNIGVNPFEKDTSGGVRLVWGV